MFSHDKSSVKRFTAQDISSDQENRIRHVKIKKIVTITKFISGKQGISKIEKQICSRVRYNTAALL